MNVAKIIHDSRIYGPGARTVIWFQGCSIKCEGCINPELIPFIKCKEFSVKELIEEVQETGVTLLGGEPLDQFEILDFMLELKKNNIKIVLFTGYEWNDLTEFQQNAISETCQFVVFGPYDKNKVNPSLYLRGSENQEIKVFDTNIYIDDKVESYEVVLGDTIEIRGRVDKDIFQIFEEENNLCKGDKIHGKIKRLS